MQFEYLLFEKKDNIGLLSFNRPEVLNALNEKVLLELEEAITWLEKNEDIYVVIFTGVGKSFIAGADIKEMINKTPEEARSFAALGSRVFRRIELMEKPSIAAINGFALGGGCELALSCDIRLASDKAKFGQPEVSLGITPGFSGTQRLTRLIGEAKAKEIIFTGKIISAIEAEKLGLINHLTRSDNLLDKAMEISNLITQNGQIAVRYAKAAINRGRDIDFDSACEIEKTYFSLCFATEDQFEGMDAFLNRRKVNFKIK